MSTYLYQNGVKTRLTAAEAQAFDQQHRMHKDPASDVRMAVLQIRSSIFDSIFDTESQKLDVWARKEIKEITSLEDAESFIVELGKYLAKLPEGHQAKTEEVLRLSRDAIIKKVYAEYDSNRGKVLGTLKGTAPKPLSASTTVVPDAPRVRKRDIVMSYLPGFIVGGQQ